jgi:hypothetical protein
LATGLIRYLVRGRRALTAWVMTGPHRPGLDQHDVDAELRDLHPQRVAERLDRVLGRVVERPAWQGGPAAHRGHVEYAAAFLAVAYTRKPASCRLRAAARPIPEEHPVMSTGWVRVVLAMARLLSARRV